MAEAIVSALLEQLTSVTAQKIEQEVRLVVGVKKEVKKLANNLLAIQDVLVDAEQRQVKEKAVSSWLDQLKQASYDMEDVLDEWKTAMLKQQIEGVGNAKKKVCFFIRSPCLYFKQVGLRCRIALKIKEINENVNNIVKMKDRFNFLVNKSDEIKLIDQRLPSTYLVDVNEIRGRVEDKNTLVRKLCENKNENNLHIISIVGMGGIGKTTLAQFAYNDEEVKNNFDKRLWVCVSDPFDGHRIARAIIESLEGSTTNLVEFNSLIQKIKELIEGKKFLLVLDDVWTDDHNKWEPFYNCLKNGQHESKILVTTRKETVACMMKSMDIINVKELSEDECWSLFRRLAFFDKSHEEYEKLEEIGRKIVGKCKGLPLAAKTIGSLLRFKKTREEWQNILDNEMWSLEEFEKGIFPPLLLSYRDLPSIIKRCFSYCSIFPKDKEIVKEDLIKLWMAEGYLESDKNEEMEIVGEGYFNFLASCSFFQELEKDYKGNITCKMHDIIHDFAQFLSKNESCSVEVDVVGEPFTNSSHGQIRYSILRLNRGASFPASIRNTKRLRSLLIESQPFQYSPSNNALLILFSKLTYLRVLKLSAIESFIKEIPKEIGKLIHLRYLNLSWQGITNLPETLCELYNLQTLNLFWCDILEKLPQRIRKLINLRHLINHGCFSLSYMPIGIQRLTCLRTLSEFKVSGGCGDNNKTASIECLKDLNHLRRNLVISGLGNVTNMSEIHGIELLKNKNNLISLKLFFDGERERERAKEDDELLLQFLQPPPSLEKLGIGYYRGNTFLSDWMASLTNLRELSLEECVNCEHLFSLERLWTDGIDSEWEELDSEITMRDEEEGDIKIMPCLSSLEISFCPKLKVLPACLLQRITLQKLYIQSCPILEERYGKETGVDWSKISHIPDISIS